MPLVMTSSFSWRGLDPCLSHCAGSLSFLSMGGKSEPPDRAQHIWERYECLAYNTTDADHSVWAMDAYFLLCKSHVTEPFVIEHMRMQIRTWCFIDLLSHLPRRTLFCVCAKLPLCLSTYCQPVNLRRGPIRAHVASVHVHL